MARCCLAWGRSPSARAMRVSVNCRWRQSSGHAIARPDCRGLRLRFCCSSRKANGTFSDSNFRKGLQPAHPPPPRFSFGSGGIVSVTSPLNPFMRMGLV